MSDDNVLAIIEECKAGEHVAVYITAHGYISIVDPPSFRTAKSMMSSTKRTIEACKKK